MSYLHAALARERQNSFLAEAAADRLARQAKLGRRRARGSSAPGPPLRLVTGRLLAWRTSPLLPGWPGRAARGKRVVLRDGSQVLIRQVQSADAPLLTDGFGRLSAQSRRMRFLTAKTHLSQAELSYFTDVDHYDHEAIGALHRLDGRGVGIARYIRSAEDPQAAEIAVAVVDEWQRRGLGTELLAQLSDRARQAGIRRFTATVTAENPAVAELLRNMGAELARRGPGTLEYEIALLTGPAHDCAAAACPSLA